MKKQVVKKTSKKIKGLVNQKNNSPKSRIILGKTKVKQYTGFKRYLTKSEINHIIKTHGDAKKEIKKGQIAVTLKDFELIPYITASADSINVDKVKKSITYIKKIESIYYVVEVVTSDKYKKIFLKTMYKKAV